jgi:MazG family protein
MAHPIPRHENTPEPALNRLRKVVHILRAPGGCPWDIEQTHESLVPNLLEEAYETAEALRSGDRPHMCEELGDLLLQVVMHAEIASESPGNFDFDGVADGVAEKLIRRHPHVFGESDATDTEAVLRQWDEIKRGEKGGDQLPKKPRVLDNISRGLPALIRAAKIQKKAARVGFDWPDARDVLPKIREEIDEVEEALGAGEPEALAEELGDLLFAVVNLTRKLNLDAESLLAQANTKFIGRFDQVEDALAAKGIAFGDATLEEMDAVWDAVKVGRG